LAWCIDCGRARVLANRGNPEAAIDLGYFNVISAAAGLDELENAQAAWQLAARPFHLSGTRRRYAKRAQQNLKSASAHPCTQV
jgi:hypothetical protein